MEQDDGFCGSCGAIIDEDLIDDGLGDDPPTSPNLMAPAPVLEVSGSGGAFDRGAVLGAIDMGDSFDERTDVAPPPMDDLPPPVAVAPAAPPRPVEWAAAKPADQPGDPFQSFLEEKTGAFGVDDAGVFNEETGTHRADRQAMVQPQVVLRAKPGVDQAALSPFEQHVLSFLDGHRPLARLRKKAGLGFSDLKVAIGMLADRGVIEVVGSYKPDVRSLLEESELADSGPLPVIREPPSAPSSPSPPKADPRPPPMPLPGQGARPSVMPLPGQGRGPPKVPQAPPPPAASAPPPVVVNNAAVRAQANQLLERALAELRAGKRPAALALMHMAAELLPGDPRIEELRRTLLAR